MATAKKACGLALRTNRLMRNIPEAKKRSATAQPNPADHAPLTPSVTAKRTTGTKPTSADGSTATIDNAVNISDDPDVAGDNLRNGDLLMLERGVMTVLMQVTNVAGQQVTFGTGTGDPGYTFNDEIHPELSFTKPYLLAMANAGLRMGRGTNGSQFFVCLDDLRGGLAKNYNLFGQVVEERAQPGIKRRPGPAGALRHGKSPGQAADFGDFPVVVLMVGAHHGDGAVDPRPAAPADRGEQDQLLLLHMHLQRPDHPPQQGGQTLGHILVAEMHILDPLGHRGKFRQLRAVGHRRWER